MLEAYDALRSRFDVVICEGAGSPAEINLRRNDIVNLGLARARGLPVILVGDIDRGGVFAALYGTLALLDAADQVPPQRVRHQQVPRPSRRCSPRRWTRSTR